MNPFSNLLALSAVFASVINNGDTPLMAGAAETVITPAIVLPNLDDVNWIGAVGAGHYTPKEGELMPTYGDLYARALVLADGTQHLAIVTADLGGFNMPDVEILIGAISKASGIPKDNIIVNTSHTHNAPWPGDDHLSGLSYPWNEDEQISTVDDVDILYEEWLGEDEAELEPYLRWLFGRIAEVVKRAASDPRPATLRVGREPAQIAYNRWVTNDEGEEVMAPNPSGSMVPWVDVLGAYDETGRRIAVLFSCAAHPVIIMDFDHAPSFVDTVIGPDFPGYTIKHLRNLLDKDGEPEGIFMFAQVPMLFARSEHYNIVDSRYCKNSQNPTVPEVAAGTSMDFPCVVASMRAMPPGFP